MKVLNNSNADYCLTLNAAAQMSIKERKTNEKKKTAVNIFYDFCNVTFIYRALLTDSTNKVLYNKIQ